MTTLLRWFGVDGSKWERVGPQSLWSATALVVVAWSLMALTRFGGLVTTAPRAFTRLALVGVWGWIGLTLAVWVLASLFVPRRPPLRETFGIVGLAHIPVLVLSFVIFVSAVMAQFLGPGFAVALFVFGLWFPATLTTGVHHVLALSPARAAVAVLVPYAAWLLVIGRHVLGQVQHLL